MLNHHPGDNLNESSGATPAWNMRGAEDGPPRRRSRIEDDDDDDDRDIERRPKKKKKSRPNPILKAGKRYLDMLPLPAKIVIGLALVAMFASCLHPICYLVPVVYGTILIILGGLLFVVVVFNDSPIELLLCMFIPFYSLYYLVTHFEETKATLYLQLFGILVCFSFLCALPFHAAFFAAKNAIVGAAPKEIAGANDNRPPIGQPGPVDPLPKDKPPPAKDGDDKQLPPVPVVTGDQALDRLLSDFQSKDHKTSDAALRALKAMKPNHHQAAVVKRLNEHAKSGGVGARHAFLDIMKTWATAEDTPLLLGYLDDGDIHTRNLALQALGEVRDPRATERILQTLLNLPTQWHSEQALFKMGPIAEPGLLDALKKKQDVNVQIVIVRLLGQVGTGRSIPLLQAFIANGPPQARGVAQASLNDIQRRLKK